jgi:hypothetical protein
MSDIDVAEQSQPEKSIARMWSSAQTKLFAESIVVRDKRVFKKGRTKFKLRENTIMLWTILVVLLLLWLVGFYGGFVTTSLIHLLLVGAVVVLALTIFRRRNPA